MCFSFINRNQAETVPDRKGTSERSVQNERPKKVKQKQTEPERARANKTFFIIYIVRFWCPRLDNDLIPVPRDKFD